MPGETHAFFRKQEQAALFAKRFGPEFRVVIHPIESTGGPAFRVAVSRAPAGEKGISGGPDTRPWSLETEENDDAASPVS